MESTYPLQMVKHVVENGTAPPTSIFLFERPTLFFFPSKISHDTQWISSQYHLGYPLGITMKNKIKKICKSFMQFNA
jgi:hypothetical protein